MRTAAKIFVLLFAINVSHAATNEFARQLITLPADVSASCFADLDHDGRADLLAVDSVEKKILIYRQRAFGFTNVPDQVLALPPQTGWIAPCDVDAHPGVELLMSTVTGLVYHRQLVARASRPFEEQQEQTGGTPVPLFDSELHTLIKADQVFTNDDSPSVISLVTNIAIPVISATRTILYQRNDAFEWKPGAPVALDAKHASWSGNRNEWIMGANSSHGLHIQQSFRPESKDTPEELPGGAAFKKLNDDMKKVVIERRSGTNRMDLNGDGRMDLVFWQIVGDLDYRTDVYVFLRGADDKLPERPTQILHCRGIPIPIGSTFRSSPIADLKGDGTYELVLMELKSSVTSASSLIEMALSRGVDLGLTIRTFHNGVFSGSADATIIVKVVLTSESLEEWPMFICGDFNGDGRPDFAVRRTADQWNIIFSTNDGSWFSPEPAMTFEAPMPGYFEIGDLNGDGRSDIILRARNDPRIFIFLSQSQRKGNP